MQTAAVHTWQVGVHMIRLHLLVVAGKPLAFPSSGVLPFWEISIWNLSVLLPLHINILRVCTIRLHGDMCFHTHPNQAIVEDVQSGGSKSLIAQALRLGDIKSESDPLLLGPAEMKAAYDQLPEEDQQVLLRTKVKIEIYVSYIRCG